MKVYPHKVFERDRVLRDSQMKPVGRVILAGPYVEGEDIKVTLLRVPRVMFSSILGQVFYVDGQPYRVPTNTPRVKVGGNKLEHFVNSFVLQKVSQ